jgi:hypothetical protein
MNIKNMMNKNKKDVVIRISDFEKELIRELVKSEKANLEVFSLPKRKENIHYENVLKKLDLKLA